MTYALALGPFHPIWRGPQRILLRINGERIADLEYRDGFNERGCAERLARLDLPQALHLVTRICGTCSFAHSLAFCQALEQLCKVSVPERAAYLRCAIAEVERLSSHLQAAATLLDSLGMEPRAATLLRVRESSMNMMKALSGARIIPDMCLPGGLRRNVTAQARDEALVALPKLNRVLYGLIDGLVEQRALLARTAEVGTLPRTAAEQFGVLGTMARASGIARDARADHPYAAYDKLTLRVITQEGGDVYGRLMVLLLEAFESIKLVDQALQDAPDGDWQTDFPNELLNGTGNGVAEGPRGTLRYVIESKGGRIAGVRIDAPRQIDRLLARTLLSGALVDNAIPIIASCDCCTACAER